MDAVLRGLFVRCIYLDCAKPTHLPKGPSPPRTLHLPHRNPQHRRVGMDRPRAHRAESRPSPLNP
jgi:hypothetical protein